MAANYEPIMLPDIEEIQAEREEKIRRDLTFLVEFEEVTLHCAFFREKEDCTGKLGISPLIKCTSAIRQLAYGTVPDALDEYLQMGHAISRQSLEHFCRSIIPIFGPEFLEKPTITDIERLYAFHEEKLRRDHGPDPFILLEAVASQDLWIWHAFFGVSGANNDINVIQRSLLLNDLKLGKAPEILFVTNDVTYPWRYYLCDGIYPEWVPFVKSVTNLSDDDHKRLRYKAMHEAARKDVERAFGVLKKQWAILATPARAYIKEKLANIMYTCIILHNMIIKDHKEAICPEWYLEEEHQPDDLIRFDEQRHRIIMYIKSSKAHQMLKADLIEQLNRNV
ncbi:ALP1-like protein [Tanacetum coccineum]